MSNSAETHKHKGPSCCPPEPVDQCGTDGHHHHTPKWDWMLWICGIIVTLSVGAHLLFSLPPESAAGHFTHSVTEMISKMWWGVLAGIFFIGVMGQVPQGIVMRLLGTGTGFRGIWRATIAGFLFDLCSHGILMVGMKLYERGASLGQVMAFLIASPWNSFSLTLILWGLIGFKWMLAFLLLSIGIGLVSGVIFDKLVARGILPGNHHRQDEEAEGTPQTLKIWWQQTKINFPLIKNIVADGMESGRIVVRWMLLGVVLAAAIRVFMPLESFQNWFGPTMLGLLATMIAATVIEVCSEGATPIAADILTRAAAPGNSFAFLMSGVATDYTEVMVLKDTTKSWKIALFLPLVVVPQVAIIAILMNILPI
ncbi:MAG: ATPase [Pseudomonadota bacterium]|nr:ATPase [Pseudomonadota bacterium]QKK05041.1 MAG: ATPase [Pseudomonadota bacterium]